MDIVKSSDYIIDLGPEGGSEGGNLLFEGTPEKFLSENKIKSHTKEALKNYF
jgi:excinuclease ABC subunit A